FPDPIQNLWRRLMMRSGHRLGLPLRDENALCLLDSGSAILAATRDLLRGARHSIVFEIYIWAEDQVGREIAELLLEAKRRGVAVRGIVDDFGSWGSAALLSKLDQAGIHLLRYHPVRPWRRFGIMNRRNHRKLLICDGAEAVVGSANWGEDYDQLVNPDAFLDEGVVLRGPIVGDLGEDFQKVWRRAGGEVFELAGKREAAIHRGPWSAPVSVQLVTSAGRRGTRAIRQHLRLMISQAQQELLIANAYFVPGVRLTRALCRAAARGVSVRILVPGRSDSGFVQAAGRASYGKLLGCGVRIFERQGRMLHSKAAVFDEGVALVGSGNLDPRSFRLNLELNLAIHHPGTAEALRRIFENYQAESVEIQAEAWARRPWWHRAYEQFAYRFRWLL
ncbi:MAG: phosphatidylserine/phosphatidylglycerophosphate/cardiolipin synthase family protein, partial [Acidobacteriota bacterium]|nr:phosphatidylserine/phosphatidylglycerophosphate/cardiolipin synthase family protein [Acidobacteriota bacterium]